MSGGRKPKARGTAFEYKIRNWFNEREGWTAERVLLSGAVKQAADEIGKNDVKARHESGIFLQLECKKTAQHDEHVILWEWIEKIDFDNDEFLVFAFGRSKSYVLVRQEDYAEVDENFIPDAPEFVASGATRFKCKRQWLEEVIPLTVLWKPHKKMFVLTELEPYIEKLEVRGPLKTLKPLETIKAADDMVKLRDWYGENKQRLTSYERSLYYAKLHRLENDIPDRPTNQYVASVQWWRDTSEDFIMKCPHCDQVITNKDLQDSADNE